MALNGMKRFIEVCKGMIALLLVVITGVLSAQTPLITVRFANPQNDCPTGEYCLDVEARSDIPDQEIFGINVRFFYDDQLLELIDFRNYEGGYGPVAPDPPILTTSEPAGPALFNFQGPAEFVNGAIQLVNTGEPPIFLDTANWTRIFQVCFNIDGPIMNLDTFCPPVVWDLEQDPANGGFLAGDDGVVITVVDPDPNNESLAADEGVDQFNWQYTGNGTPPYGEPVETVCSNVNCALPVSFLYFKGNALSRATELQWAVAGEFNVEGYEVQRSQDALLWNVLGFVPSNGNAAASSSYNFTDILPLPGRNYYRVMARDGDGQKRFSNLIHISRPDQYLHQDWFVYPNPVQDGDFTVFSIVDPGPDAQIHLFDISGKLLLRQRFNYPFTAISTETLGNGLYTLVLQTPEFNLLQKISVIR